MSNTFAQTRPTTLRTISPDTAAVGLFSRSVKSQPKAKEAFMRAHHAIAVVAVVLISFGVKIFFFSPPTAEADIHAVQSAGMNDLAPWHKPCRIQNPTLPGVSLPCWE